MKPQFLGDSYDLVKRFWAERLASIAPLFAHPKFVPSSIEREYKKLVGIRILTSETVTRKPFGLFLDPDTGIPLPTASSQNASIRHAPVSFISREMNRLKPKDLICFDQSHNRNCGLTKEKQRHSKIAALRELGIASFYYVSHAPFLFAARDVADLELIRLQLVESGIPEWRLHKSE
jgi:hypothetical protein